MATPDRPAPPVRTRSRRKRLGEMLVDQGVLTPEQLEDALDRQRAEKGTRLGRLLVDLGYATDVQICEVIAEQLQIPAADMVAVDVANDVLARLSRKLATQYMCIPWFVEGRELYLIMADPTNVAAADAVAFHTGLRVKPVVAPESEIAAALDRLYAAEEQSLAQFDNLDLADQLSVVAEQDLETSDEEEAQNAAAGAPLVKLVNAILADAIRAGASDVHVEPQQKGIDLRYRVDGLLRKVMTMPKRVQGRLVSRIKVMAHMDISEKRKPQDGRTFLTVATRRFDLRVSTLPTADGEKVVLRILAQDRAQVALEDLGFEGDLLATLKDVLSRPQGMILVTGPTGSGKTSTLYAALNFLRSETTNIVTVEDPVEYRLAGITQVAVSDKAGLSFAAGLRSILRQDPDVVMVGEIRDLETAQIAFQAAQTGHLVLSTLHTNDAPGAVSRLVEMGIPGYVVASSLLAVLAQRLIRRLCDCKAPQPDGTAEPRGCERCRFGGFAGRTGVSELMRLTPRVRSVVVARGPEDLLRSAARAAGMKSMSKDALARVAAGLTTVAEVRRAVPPDDLDEDEESSAVPAARVPAALSIEVATPRRSRILLVDDDPGILEVLRDIFASENYDVTTARDGEEALAEVYRHRPDLVLTDLQMPRLDGVGLLRKLRGDLATCQIPVLFLTVVDSPDREIEALDLGADDFVTKPVQRARLLGRVRRALFRSHLQQAAP